MCGVCWGGGGGYELPRVTEKVVMERHEAVESSAADTHPLLMSIHLKQDSWWCWRMHWGLNGLGVEKRPLRYKGSNEVCRLLSEARRSSSGSSDWLHCKHIFMSCHSLFRVCLLISLCAVVDFHASEWVSTCLFVVSPLILLFPPPDNMSHF